MWNLKGLVCWFLLSLNVPLFALLMQLIFMWIKLCLICLFIPNTNVCLAILFMHEILLEFILDSVFLPFAFREGQFLPFTESTGSWTRQWEILQDWNWFTGLGEVQNGPYTWWYTTVYLDIHSGTLNYRLKVWISGWNMKKN